MRIAILADVHGNLPALESVVSELVPFHPNRILVAGDLVGGPQTNECIYLLRDLGATMILGNSDINLLRHIQHAAPEAWYTHPQFVLRRWNAKNLSDENFQFLSKCPEQRVISFREADAIRLVHGSPRSPDEGIYPALDPRLLEQALNGIAEPVLVCGHTHEPWIRPVGKKLAVNPGAVGCPVNGETGAQYACLELEGQHWQAELFNAAYDLSQAKKAFLKSGLLEEGGPLARAFLLSIQTGQDVTRAFLSYAAQLAEQAGGDHAEAIPDEFWEQANVAFPWERWEG